MLEHWQSSWYIISLSPTRPSALEPIPKHKFTKAQEYPDGTREDFLSKCESGAFDGVTALYRSNDSTKVTGPFDATVAAALPASLKFIAHNGAGYDTIDVGAFTARGIAIANTPTAVNDATADIAVFLMLGALRRATAPLLAAQRGGWRGARYELGHDPRGKTLGVLGMGGIGRNMAAKARAFGMTLQYHNRRRLSPEEEEGAVYVSFEELLRTSDVFSLNLGLSEQTRHIIGAREFAMMKEGVVVVNTARGPLIDEEALVQALKEGKVWGAGLDVFEEEPKIHPELLDNEKVFLLPHLGTSTFETQREMELLVLENLKLALTEGRLKTQVPEQKGAKL